MARLEDGAHLLMETQRIGTASETMPLQLANKLFCISRWQTEQYLMIDYPL